MQFSLLDRNAYTYNSLDDVPASVVADCAFLMDSLEYIDDEPAFLARVAGHVRQGGYIFFTLPAFRKLFSQHDVIVRLLRRYDKRDFVDIVSRTQGLSIAGMHYFYTPLLLIRFIQKTFHLEIDPEHKVTTGWRYGDRHIITRCAEWLLDADYACHALLCKTGIDIPGLSIFAAVRRT